jgi:hypothetical protein
MKRFNGATLGQAAALLLFFSGVAHAVRIEIETVQANPGGTVSVSVFLFGEGERVAGTQNDIVFDPAVIDLRDEPACRINPAIGDRLDECQRERPDNPCKSLFLNLSECPEAEGCPAGSDGLRRLRAFVLSLANTNLIPDGPLYSCEFSVAGDAPAGGVVVLENLNVASSTPDGFPLRTIGSCGTVLLSPAQECMPPSCGPGEALHCPHSCCPADCGLVCVTPTPTPTPTLTRPPTHTPTPFRIVQIDIGTIEAQLGETIEVPVTLTTAGATVSAVQNDIVFDPRFVSLSGPSACRINPAISDRMEGCDGDPPSGPCKSLQRNLSDCPAAVGCPPDSEGLQRLRALVLSLTNLNPIPDGVLYTCEFLVSPDAPDEPIVLRNLNIGASSPAGEGLNATGSCGVILTSPLAECTVPSCGPGFFPRCPHECCPRNCGLVCVPATATPTSGPPPPATAPPFDGASTPAPTATLRSSGSPEGPRMELESKEDGCQISSPEKTRTAWLLLLAVIALVLLRGITGGMK